ncbi:MAG: hypothetical protein ACFB51_22065 [Anaerolineae bacterium]
MTVESVENTAERIIFLTIKAPYGGAPDAREAADRAYAFHERLGEPVWAIWDFSQGDLDFARLVEGMAVVAELPDAYYENVTSIVVGTDAFPQLIAESAGQEQYGGRDVTLVGSMEEALARVQATT